MMKMEVGEDEKGIEMKMNMGMGVSERGSWYGEIDLNRRQKRWKRRQRRESSPKSITLLVQLFFLHFSPEVFGKNTVQLPERPLTIYIEIDKPMKDP